MLYWNVETREDTFDLWILSSLQLIGWVEVYDDTEAGVIFHSGQRKAEGCMSFNDILFSKVIRKNVEEATEGSCIQNHTVLLYLQNPNGII